MGATLTAFENRSSIEIEIRVFEPPARPDKFRKIIRFKPGETKELVTKSLVCKAKDPENPTFLIVFIDGVNTGIFFVPLDVIGYAKIICDINDDGLVDVRCIRDPFPGFRRIKGFSRCLGTMGRAHKRKVEKKQDFIAVHHLVPQATSKSKMVIDSKLNF